jgi:hypothetical protein
MSSYETSTVQFGPSIAEEAAIRGVWSRSPATLCSSVQLGALATQLTAAAALTQQPTALTGTLASIEALLGDERMTRLATTNADAVTQLAEARERLAVNDEAGLARSAAQLFSTLTPVLGREERIVTVAASIDTLLAEGYTVIHESGIHADGIEARRGDEVMLLAVTDGGRTSSDHAGVGGACQVRQLRYEAGLARRGLTVQREVSTPHDDVSPPLIMAAARARERSLALAVARHTQPPLEDTRGSQNRRQRHTAPRRAISGGNG